MSENANKKTYKTKGYFMENQSQAFSQEVKEAIKTLTDIHENLGKNIKSHKEEGVEIINELKKDVENIKNYFEEIGRDILKEGSHALNKEEKNNSFLKTLENRLEEIKPFFENMIENIKEPPVKLGEVIDVMALKIKLAEIYTKIFVRNKLSNFFNRK